jgi:hypothetical protein
MTSSTEKFYWKIWCNTTSSWEYTWKLDIDGPPVYCPTNASHTIDTSLSKITSVLDTVGTPIQIVQEVRQTGGNFRWDSIAFTAIANTTTTHTFSYPIPITVMSAEWQTAAENTGDIVSWTISKNTIIGAITTNVTIGDTVIYVSATVTANIKVGFLVNLYNGVDTDKLGIVKSINTITGTITTETAATINFLASSPTYVRMGVPFLLEVELGHPMQMQIGQAKVMGSYVPANTVVTCEYENKSVSGDKRICAHIELLY